MWVEVLCWIDRVCSSKECVCCACDPSVHVDVTSIGLVYVCMSEVISSFRGLTAGSQVFALLMLFLCVILHTMWSGKSMQLLCILPFGILCLFCHKNDVGGYCRAKANYCVFGKLCPVGFL